MFLILNILSWALVLILFVVLILLLLWMVTGYRSKVPFVPVHNSIIPDIYKALDIKNNSVLYDLGCNDGRVLFYISKIVPDATYIGIESSPFPLILAKARAWWHKKTKNIKINIFNKDFFTQDLSSATHIFIYLYPNVMDDLLPKFDRELKKGTKLVSVNFKFTQKQPDKEFTAKKSKNKIYIYEF